jgi:hypothetical protein
MRAGSENFSGLRVFQQTGMMGARWKLYQYVIQKGIISLPSAPVPSNFKPLMFISLFSVSYSILTFSQFRSYSNSLQR